MQVVSPVQLDFISEGDYFPFLIEHEAARHHGSSPTGAAALDTNPQPAIPKPVAPDVGHTSGEHPAQMPGSNPAAAGPERAKRHRDWDMVLAEEGQASQSVVRCAMLSWTVPRGSTCVYALALCSSECPRAASACGLGTVGVRYDGHVSGTHMPPVHQRLPLAVLDT
jgi:hypothetical protein